MSIPIDKSLSAIRTDIYGRVSTVQQDGWLPERLSLDRGPVRGMIELWSWGLYQLYQFLSHVLGQQFPSLASGKWLDLHCAQVEVTRLAATRARGIVQFSRAAAAGNVKIAAGRIVKTKPDGLGNVYRFVTTADAVLADGQPTVDVAVEAESYGRASNVTTGQISEIVTVIPGVDAVTNPADWMAGEGDDEETDARLRERYALAWMALNGATKYAYESWARSVSGVVAVTVLDRHPRGQGTVDVVVKGAAGAPTQELLDSVDAVVREQKPINDDVLVRGPVTVAVDIAAELEITGGEAAEIVAAAEERIEALFLDPSPIAGIAPLEIGEDLTLDRLVSEIMAAGPEIKRINRVSPENDVEVGPDALVVLNSLALTHVAAEK